MSDIKSLLWCYQYDTQELSADFFCSMYDHCYDTPDLYNSEISIIFPCLLMGQEL